MSDARRLANLLLCSTLSAALWQPAAWAQTPAQRGTPEVALTAGKAVWRLRYSDPTENDPSTPRLVDHLSSENFVASFVQDPYLLFDEDDKTGELRVYSDVGFRARLAPRAAGGYDLVDPADGAVVGTVDTTSQWCIDLIATERTWCFELAIDAAKNPLLHRRLQNANRTLWVPMRPISLQEQQRDADLKQAAVDAAKKSAFGDLFTGRIYNFGWSQRCYDMASIDPFNISNANCGAAGSTKNLFKLVNDELAFRWENIGEGGQTAVPYGWRFVPRVNSSATTTTTTLSTSREIQRSVETSLGINSKVNAFFVSVESKVSVNAKQMSDEMRSSKTTVTRSDYIATHSAFVLDKTNAALTDEFLQAVETLKADVRNIKPATLAFSRFVDEWGTHYSAATTYGARGHYTFRMSEDDVMTVLENGIDVNVSVTVGAQMDGIGGEAGVSTGTKVDGKQKASTTLSSIAHTSECQGGGTCNNGEPSDNNRVVPILLDLRPISELLAPPFTRDVEVLTTLHDGVADEIARRTLFDGDDTASAQFMMLGAPQLSLNAQGAASTVIEIKQGDKVLTSVGKDPTKPVYVIRVPATGNPNLTLASRWILPPGIQLEVPNQPPGSRRFIGCAGEGEFGPAVTGDSTKGPVTQTIAFEVEGARLRARGPSCAGSRDNPAFGDWFVDTRRISGSEALNLAR